MWGYGWGFWLGMSVMMVVFWGAIILGIVVLIRYFRQRSDAGRPVFRTGPEDMLAQRFARGEINEEEYRRRLEALRASR
jgi:putative membrane protein